MGMNPRRSYFDDGAMAAYAPLRTLGACMRLRRLYVR